MDSLTHIALGACIGEITLGRKLGRAALGWGALAASLPDIDAVSGLFLTLPEELVAHRGITHSLLFACIAPFILTYLCARWYKRHKIANSYYLLFFLLQILLHDLLDSCNAYGTGLLEPFSNARFSFNILYVADPLFSIWLIIAATFIFLYRKNRLYQRRMAAGALLLSTIYMGVSINNKLIAKAHLTASLSKQTINATDYFITPTPFNNMLWYGVARTDSGYLVGHLSVFDDKKDKLPFNYFSRNDHFLDSVENKEEVEKLKKFASGYYTVERWNDTLVFNVLRFGQMIGWQEPKAHFAFHYFLNPGYNNELVVQRGRFEGWNRQTLNFMYRRIKGSIEEETPAKISR
jgi:inner membrane protein